ncbi:MAG: pyrroline-5-carboxylate reductase [Pirellulaceae bacterium]|nr:pyrroline-5-carboxylate reductase [Pirellulaceae bacterium]
MQSETIGFIGAGQMATALTGGFLDKNLLAPTDLFAYDTNETAQKKFLENYPQTTFVETSQQLVEKASTIILAIKPQYLPDLLTEISSTCTSDKRLLSIAAGASLTQLEKALPNARLIRAMPNTPCLIGEGACGFSLGQKATPDDKKVIERLLGAVGLSFEVAEPLLDTVTGLSGSGPAYIYQIIEALSDGGVQCGLPRTIALQLAAQTVKGAAQMLLSTGLHPGQLKDNVASPGGTTIAGLATMERHGVRGALIATVESATSRAKELGAQ